MRRHRPPTTTTIAASGAAAILSATLLLGFTGGAAAGQAEPVPSRRTPDLTDHASIQRLGGPDRYATAVAISQRFFADGAPAVFVATGETFPDALAAGPAADRLGGPVLLTRRTALPPVTRDEIERLAPRQIFVAGDTPSVSAGVLAELDQMASQGANRIAGVDRYETAAAISQAFHSSPSVVYVATGEGFPDGLVSGAAATEDGSALLLVRRDAIPAVTRNELERLAPETIVIAGATPSVSSGVEEELGGYANSVVRRGGADRFETSALISRAVFPDGATSVFVATGMVFPDALGAAPVGGGPTLLVHPSFLPSSVADELVRLDPDQVFILGEEPSVSTAVAAEIEALLVEGAPCSAGDKPPPGGQQVFDNVPGATGQVALTFDMGGRLDPAIEIMEFLLANDVCATIFPTGAMSETQVGQQVLAIIGEHPELFEVGNHTMHHCDLVRGGGGSPTTAPCATGGAPSPDFIRAQLTDAAAILQAGTGQDPAPYWRPPYGSYNQAVLDAAASVGYTKTFLWDVDTVDWLPVSEGGPTAEEMAALVIENAGSGSNVLMHLGGYETLDALHIMVPALRDRGFTLTSLSDMLN